MKRVCAGVTAVALTLATIACSDTPSDVPGNEELAAAFNSVLFGFQNAESSFAGGPDGGMAPWGPRGGAGFKAGPGFMMGGGLDALFLGEGFAPGFGHGKFGHPALRDCEYNAASGRLVCETATRNGLTITRSLALTDASGKSQSGFDSLTTNTINVRMSVSGTLTRRDGAATTVEHASDRTVSGLAAGSTQRTVNGTSAGRETTKGSNDKGSFTAVRTLGDTIQNVTVPTRSDGAKYPLSGTVSRSMQVTLTYDGGSSSSSSRREVVTYNGSDTATVVITRDGETRTCTMKLPRGKPVCAGQS
ncbi:MAG: hypothetical protein HY701_11490 [Gemmatimonadetes bacterium]|nr:hypothetical protein [Gemmatimonadota bacterium]